MAKVKKGTRAKIRALLDALAGKALTNTEYRVLCFIIDRTLRFDKDIERIPYRQFQEGVYTRQEDVDENEYSDEDENEYSDEDENEYSDEDKDEQSNEIKYPVEIETDCITAGIPGDRRTIKRALESLQEKGLIDVRIGGDWAHSNFIRIYPAEIQQFLMYCEVHRMLKRRNLLEETKEVRNSLGMPNDA